MKRALIQYSMALAAALSIVTIVDSPARAQSTAFTYQGRLDDAGQPANGLHDLRFRLFDVASGGAQIGSTSCTDNVTVVDGVFTTQLDFGQQFATTGLKGWLLKSSVGGTPRAGGEPSSGCPLKLSEPSRASEPA